MQTHTSTFAEYCILETIILLVSMSSHPLQMSVQCSNDIEVPYPIKAAEVENPK